MRFDSALRAQERNSRRRAGFASIAVGVLISLYVYKPLLGSKVATTKESKSEAVKDIKPSSSEHTKPGDTAKSSST